MNHPGYTRAVARRLPWLFVVFAGLVVAGFIHVAGGLEGLGLSRGSTTDVDAALLDAVGDDLSRDPVRLGGQGEALRAAAGDAGPSMAAGERPPTTGAAAGDASVGLVVAFGGTLKDSAGRPVVGGQVTLQGHGRSAVLETDRAGRFRTELQPGRYNLRFDSPQHGGLLMRAYLVDGATGVDAEFVLREAVQFEATVLRDGVGLSGVDVTLKPYVEIGEQTHTTDASGTAFFERVIAGPYSLIATGPDGASMRRRVHLQKDEVAKLVFPPGVPVEGLVKDAASGLGIPNATVRAIVRASGGVHIDVDGETGPDGRYVLDVPQGRVTTFEVAADGYASWPPRKKRNATLRKVYPVIRGKPSVVDAAMTLGMRVEGCVTDTEGKPVEGVELRFNPRRGGSLSTTSGEDGRYVLEGVEKERYTVVVMTEGWFTDTSSRLNVRSGASDDAHIHDVTVRPTLTLQGFVYYAKDKPATAARVWITGGDRVLKSARGAGRDLETFTDSAGFWRLADLPANQTVSVRASIGTLEAKPRTVKTSALPDTVLTLRLQPTVTVRGRVFDLDTRNIVPGASVRITARGGPGGRTARTVRTDANGEYVAYELIPGGWNLMPVKRGYVAAAPREETLAKDDEVVEIDLMLDPGRAIAGTATDPSGRPLAKVWVSVNGTGPDGKRVRNGARSDVRGAFRVAGLPPGRYSVTATRSGYRRKRLGSIQAGHESLDVVLTAR